MKSEFFTVTQEHLVLDLHFNNVSDAFNWLEDYIHNTINDSCDDNYRFCYIGDPETELMYDKQLSEGGDGFMDIRCMINGRASLIGCNYGH